MMDRQLIEPFTITVTHVLQDDNLTNASTYLSKTFYAKKLTKL